MEHLDLTEIGQSTCREMWEVIRCQIPVVEGSIEIRERRDQIGIDWDKRDKRDQKMGGFEKLKKCMKERKDQKCGSELDMMQQTGMGDGDGS